MITARRISVQSARCISLLNSSSKANLRLLIPTSRIITNTTRSRISAPPLRTFHSSALLYSPTEILEELVESLPELTEITESDPELESVIEIENESKVEVDAGLGGVTRFVTEATISQIGTERREYVSPKQKEHEGKESIIEELEEGGRDSMTTGVEKEASGESEEGQNQIPWFLRVETPRPASHPFAQRQALPELPDDPPPALGPLLKHLSEELGINNMALIDLRSMDPPPAIGANTIMIVGNARSERHLYMSADKVCRWLRSDWKMAPYADGLLGRNESKIRDRRLKRRGKLVNTQTGLENGVGWICVDVGSQGLVIQLFTPHRREEINLEELWGKYLKKGAITKSPRPEPISVDKISSEKKPDDKAEDVIVRYSPPVPTVRLGVGLSTGSSYSNIQKRYFHITTPWRVLETIQPSNPLNPKSPYIIDGIKFRGLEVPKSVENGKHWQLIKQLPPTYSPDSHSVTSELILRAHINYLKTRFPGLKATGSREGPCTLLGSGPEDRNSTEFLKTFHDNLPTTPTLKRFQLHLEFLIEAHRITPAQYPASCLLSHLDSMLAFSISPPQEFYYCVLRAFSESPTYRNTSLAREEATATHLSAMNEVISHMKLHCRHPHTHAPEFQFCFLRALVNKNLPLIQRIATTVCDPIHSTSDKVLKKHSQKLHMGTYYLDPRIHILDKELRKANHTYTLREYQETLLTAYAMSGAWIAFWNVWFRLRYSGVRRDGGFYALAIGLLVMGGNQRECVYAARTLVNGMEREVPVVLVKEGLARGILKLLEIAEGTGEVIGEGNEVVKSEKVKSEWKILREDCEMVIRKQKLEAKAVWR